MIWVIFALIALNIVCITFLITLNIKLKAANERASKYTYIDTNKKIFMEYLGLHLQLQKATGAVLEIKRLNDENLMLWEA